VVRNITVEKMKTEKSRYAVYLRGFKNDPIGSLSLTNCEFDGVADGNVIENVSTISLHKVRINGAEVQKLA
jgi:hypothetical protein